MIIYRSQSGMDNDFTPLPYAIPKNTFKEAIHKYYNDCLYENVKHCSNLPPVEEIDNHPVPKKRYYLERCVFPGKGLPEILPEGIYKVVLSITGDFDWGVTFVAKLSSKIIPWKFNIIDEDLKHQIKQSKIKTSKEKGEKNRKNINIYIGIQFCCYKLNY